MEVILIQDVTNLGYKDDIVKVRNGYGRNYLVPEGFAIMASETNRKIHAENMKQRAFKLEKIKNEAEKLAKGIENVTVKIGAKAGANGKIFGSVNAIQIAEALKEQFSFEVDRKKITIEGEHIKELGTYKAKINLHKDVKVEINLEVIAE
jgi:large subunit ribosomal protein L9